MGEYILADSEESAAMETITFTAADLWQHPMLALYPTPVLTEYKPTRKLYLVPNSYGEEIDPDFAPIPSHLEELPDLDKWVFTFVLTLIEVWAGRRSAQQLSRSCQRVIYTDMQKKIGSFATVPKIRKIYTQQALEGIAEVTVTLHVGERIRSLVLRFEGIDKRWLCSELFII